MRIIYTILLIVLIAVSFIRSQWKTTVEENNIICNAPSTQNYVTMAPDGQGGAFIAWTDFRNTTTGNDIYIQRIDKDGYTKFAENGIPVCVMDNTQIYPRLINTGDSCVIVMWNDDRTNYTNVTDLYGQKVDANGNMLWAENGIPLTEYYTPTPGGLTEATATPDGEGGIYLAWTKIYFGYSQMRAQRISAQGNSLWRDSSVVITDGAVDTRSPRIVKHPLGVALVYRHSGPGAYPIYFQMLDHSGNLRFSQPGVVVAENGPQGGTNVVLADASNGEAVAISWSRGQFGLNGKLYAQVMDINGIRKWGNEGIIINNVPGEHSELRMTKDRNTGDYYFLWKDGRRINVAYDIYAQKLNKSGQAQWTTNGILLSNTPYTFTSTSMSLNDSGVYVAWAEANNPQGHGIYVMRLNPDSTFAWPNGPVRVNTTFDSPYLITLNPDISNGGSLVLFNPGVTNTGYDVHVKYIGANGVLGGVTSIEDEQFTQPNNFYLFQNYPNPFNPSTKIRYSIPNVGSGLALTVIKVYDVLGNEVATLVDEYKTAGSYEAEFNVGQHSSADISSGVYFYRLQAGSFIEIKKMILTK